MAVPYNTAIICEKKNFFFTYSLCEKKKEYHNYCYFNIMHLHPPARQANTCLREPQGPCQPSNKHFAKYARSLFLQNVEAT